MDQPVTCWTEGSPDVTSLYHLHQVGDDLRSRSYNITTLLLGAAATAEVTHGQTQHLACVSHQNGE